MELRPYQIQLQNDVLTAWQNGARNVMAVSPTGSGKTHTATSLIKRCNVPAVFLAHRQELILQISESMASFGIYHNIVAPSNVVGFCSERHVKKVGRSFYKRDASVTVGAVRTILTRKDSLRGLFNNIQLWIQDEAHHVLPDNQWGKVTSLFVNARGLGVTATPLRCDRKALDGVFNEMVIGPQMRTLINEGHLSDYRIFCPPVALDLENIRISQSTGEFIAADVSAETERSQIVGDVVEHYLRIANGKRGLTFTVDLASAARIADTYNARGVKAAVVSAETPDRIRSDLLDRLERNEIQQLVNVDLFGEGMDCPALDVISMARPTQSYGLYVQQFGRVLRRYAGKDCGIIIDHVGNVVRHGLPDRPRDWSLSAPEGRRARTPDPDDIPLTTCPACYRPYERVRTACPYCGHVPEVTVRSTPNHVDGDLAELDPSILAAMRGEVDRVNGAPLIPAGATEIVARAIRSRWAERQTEINALRGVMASWAGRWHAQGESDREIQRRFYLSFGVDVLTAQSLSATEAEQLRIRVENVT